MEYTASWIIIIVIVVIFIFLLLYFLIYDLRSVNTLNKPCVSNSDCLDNTTCDTSQKVCKTMVGKPCSVQTDCISGSSCIAGTCVTQNNNMTQQQVQHSMTSISNVTTTSTDNNTCNDDTTYDNTTYTNNTYTHTYKKNYSTMYSDNTTTYDDVFTMNKNDNTVYATKNSNITSNKYSDIVEYEGSVLYLLSNRKTLIYNNSMITSSIDILRLEVFNNDLYCVGMDGLFYKLKSQGSEVWRWSVLNYVDIKDIVYTSVTNDAIWIQNSSMGTLYDTDFNIIHSSKVNGLRKYGKRTDIYIEWKRGDLSATSNIHGVRELHDSVYLAGFNEDNDMILVRNKEYGIYSDIRVIDNKLHYIK